MDELSQSKDRAPQDEVVESIDSTKKFDKLVENWEKGVQPEDLFSTQKLLNGRNPSPKLVRQYTAKFRYYISNYGFKGEDEKVYLKVDTKYVLVAKILFNDDKEHSFSITSHVINMDLQRSFYPADASQRSQELFIHENEDLSSKEDIEWKTMLSFANFFPHRFLSILEEVFPYVTDAVKSAEVTRQILSQEVRFDIPFKSRA